MKNILKIIVLLSVINLIVLSQGVSSWATSIDLLTQKYYFESDFLDYSWGPHVKGAGGQYVYDDLGFDPYFDGASVVSSNSVYSYAYGIYTGEYGSMTDNYFLVESTGISSLFTNAPGISISLDHDFAIMSQNDKTYGLVELNLIDAATSQIVDSFTVDSRKGDISGTHNRRFNNLDPQHSYYYELKSSAYAYINIHDPQYCCVYSSYNEGKYWASMAVSDININYATPIPEPGTLLLCGIGLAGFFVFRKKFKQ